MRRAIVAMGLLALTAVGGALTYQTAARERGYRALLSQGDAAMRDGQTFGAIEAYSGAIALRPDSMLAHLRRGETYHQRGDLDLAAKDFRTAAALDPSATRPLEALGDVLYQRQRFRRAAEVFESHLRLDDRSARVRHKLALARYRDGDLDGALTALSQTIELSDQLPEAYYLLGLCLREQGQLLAALEAFEKAVALSPGLIPAREELADVFSALGRHAEQLEQLQVIAGLDREHIERHVAVGLAHARAGHGELAVLTLGNALERTSDQSLVYGALGQVWLDMASTRSDALSKALEALERVASTAGATSEVMTLYGRALLLGKQPEAAERALQLATRRFPVDPSAFLHYAKVAEAHNHFDAARTALIEYGLLVADEPDFATRAAAIGRLSLRLNDPTAAVIWLERAAAADPRDLRRLAMLADAQLRAGDREGAKSTLARGLEQDPSDALLLAVSRRTR